MLHRPLIGLQAGESQSFCRIDRLGNGHNIRGRRDTTTTCTTVNFDKTFNLRSMGHSSLREVLHILDIVNAADSPRTQLWNARKPVNLRWMPNLI